MLKEFSFVGLLFFGGDVVVISVAKSQFETVTDDSFFHMVSF